MNTTPSGSVSLPRSIVVAYDAESMADAAVLQAHELARLFDARLEIVHAFGSTAFAAEVPVDPVGAARGNTPLARATDVMLTRTAQLLGEARGGLARAEEILRVVPGQPAAVLLERARAVGADLIVMGALRRRPVFDFGSTARAVLARARCDVWVQPCPPAPVKRVLVAVDLSRESLRALDMAVAFARCVGASVRVLHAFDVTPVALDPWGGLAGYSVIETMRADSNAEFRRVMDAYPWNGLPHECRTEDGPPAQRILDHARESDLVALGTHGRTGFAAAVLGSVAYDVLRHSPKPVLVVRDPDRRFVDD